MRRVWVLLAVVAPHYASGTPPHAKQLCAGRQMPVRTAGSQRWRWPGASINMTAGSEKERAMTDRPFETIRLERRGRILSLILDRPDQMNAVNSEMHRDLARVFQI